jgi:hypothetical protein
MAGSKTERKGNKMDPISVALGLAQFAPSIMRYFGVGEKSVGVVDKVIDIAQTITGAPTSPEALAMLQKDKELQHQFNMAVLENDSELEAAYLRDTQSARDRDVAIRANGNNNYRADSMYVLAVILIAALVIAVLKSELDEYAKGIITLVLGRFLGYLDNIYNFEFGTTRSSKTKDDTIKSLTK